MNHWVWLVEVQVLSELRENIPLGFIWPKAPRHDIEDSSLEPLRADLGIHFFAEPFQGIVPYNLSRRPESLDQ